MKNLIEILPNIYGVKVPNGIEQFHIGTLDKQILGFTRDYIFWESEIILDGEYILLGTITATEISFDASDIYDKELFYTFIVKWQTAQQNITEKLLILQKTN